MISQIYLKNFKCFDEQPLNLGKLTLLAGLNGMGKSSVLQAILLVRQSYLDGLLPNKGLTLNGELVQMGTAKDIFYEYAQDDIIVMGFTWDQNIKADLIFQYEKSANVLKLNSTPFNRKIFNLPPFNNKFQYLQAERLGPRTINEVSDYQVNQLHQLGTSGQFSEHFLFAFSDEKIKNDKLIHKSSNSRDLKSQVQAWMQEISPGTRIQLDMKSELDIISLRYSFVIGKQRTDVYRATSVGFGITYILPIIIALLSSSDGSLVLIENPEAHLHPKGQFMIGELIARAASTGIQVILETHSDHVLNGIRIAVHDKLLEPNDVAVHFFSRVEEEGKIKTKIETPLIDIKGRLDKWPTDFFDEWDKSLERLLETSDK